MTKKYFCLKLTPAERLRTLEKMRAFTYRLAQAKTLKGSDAPGVRNNS